MKQLDSVGFEKVRGWILNNARDIDKALFRYQFLDGSANAVFTALSRYQNIDDGFGKSLEPDFFTEHSSPIATTVAFQYFNKLNLHQTFENELLRNGIGYFVSHYEKDLQGWAFTLAHVNEAPHAPWWEYSPGRNSADFDPNPTAEVLGYLHEFKRFVPGEFFSEVVVPLTDVAILHLTSESKIEFHGLLCYQRMYVLMPEELKERMRQALLERILDVVSSKPNEWDSYGATPLSFVHTKASLGYVELEETVNANLDYLLERINDDGSWSPTWKWDMDEDNWKIAEQNWRSYLTVQYIKLLKNFDRIKGI